MTENTRKPSWLKIRPPGGEAYTKIKGLGSPTKKQSKQQKAYAEFEDERVPNSARTDVPAEVSPTEDTRSLWKKISDFQDPMKELAVGLSSYHQQLVHLFVLFLLLYFGKEFRLFCFHEIDGGFFIIGQWDVIIRVGDG